MTVTWTIQVDNSDNSLSQQEWAEYIEWFHAMLKRDDIRIHFIGHSFPTDPWQNVCAVIEAPNAIFWYGQFEQLLSELATRFRQPAIAITVGQTKFIEGS